MPNENNSVDWLLEGDPSVVWQAEKHLLEETERVWGATRSRIANEGWGRQLLDLQDSSGTWAGGLYQPKWTSTTYTLLQLRRLGLDPADAQAVAGCLRLLGGAEWVEGGVSYWSGRLLAERCVNGMVLSLATYFDVLDDRIDGIAALLIDSQLADGGWNCDDHRGHTHHSSFHTTISVLEGLLLWKRRTSADVGDDALASGHEFLLNHEMYRSHRTGEVVKEEWTRFHFPPRWHYDVLRGLDHLRDAECLPDDRAEGAVAIVSRRRRGDGKWSVGPSYSGLRHFKMENGRHPGRWNTLRALRVLKWWNASN